MELQRFEQHSLAQKDGRNPLKGIFGGHAVCRKSDFNKAASAVLRYHDKAAKFDKAVKEMSEKLSLKYAIEVRNRLKGFMSCSELRDEQDSKMPPELLDLAFGSSPESLQHIMHHTLVETTSSVRK